MAESPLKPEMGNVSYNITLDGSPIKDTYALLSFEVEREIGKIARAKMELLLDRGEADDDIFAPSESADFLPGKELEIKLGYDSTNDTVFKGVITNHGIKARAGQDSILVLKCQDKAVKMTLGRVSKYFKDKKDSDIISAIAGDHGVTVSAKATTVQHKQIIQYQSVDWDFILTRADANGMLVFTEDGTLKVEPPTSSGSADLKLNYGRDVYDFDGEIDARFQWPSATAKSWDMKTQAMLSATSTEPTLNKQGNLAGKKLSEVVGISDVTLGTTGTVETEELTAWAKASLLRSRLSAMRGKVTFFGNAKPKLNTLIELEGFGARFNGSALITRIRHIVREGDWRTEVGFGLSPEYDHPASRMSTPPAAGLLPSIHGLQNGTVKKIDADPDGEHRIQVDVPVIDPAGDGIWARIAQPYATTGKGYFFMPEVGDEVVLGFLNDDPRYPVIVGSLYSSKIAAPYTADSENSTKAIWTKADLKIECNDKDKVITISTPGGNSFELSDKDKSIILKDMNGNKMEMAAAGITFNSAKDFTVKATGNISLTAKGEIDVKATADLGLNGRNVTAQGQVGFTGKGGATAELSAAGQTTVKGAMVMIN